MFHRDPNIITKFQVFYRNSEIDFATETFFALGEGGGEGNTTTFLKSWRQSIFQAEKLTENSCQYGKIL